MSTLTVAILFVAALAVLTEAVSRHPVVVVVMFDAFRPDYVRPDVTPHLARFREESASPPYMRPAFPTVTFVNRFTIATGLYPETHGVLANNMFDRNNGTMHESYEQYHYDESIVPIWIQNENCGDERYSGVMMMGESEYQYQGKTPTYIQKKNISMPWNYRVEKIMSWIKDEKKPANLIFAYFDEPDHTGHMYGVGSQEINDQIARVDTTFKYLLDKITQERLESKINLIVLSDHGMDTVTYDKIIFLDKYISTTTSNSLIMHINGFVNPFPGKFDEVYLNLKNGANTLGTFDVYKQDQIPNRWHMKNTSRLNGIIYLLAKPGHTFWDHFAESLLNQTTKANLRYGVHGYDNEEPTMRAVFMARGPAFKRNFTALPFDNVDLYPLISRVLGLEELPENVRPNGTMAGVEQLLRESNVQPPTPFV